MALTKQQVAFLNELICTIEQGQYKEGEIRIEIKNGHVRRVYAASVLYFPVPGEEDDCANPGRVAPK